MKTILTAALLLATALVAMPGATACEVTDPTGTTYTCVDSDEYSYGDCAGGDGYEYSSTYASTYMPGQFQAGASTFDFCYADSWGNDYAGSGASAYAYEFNSGTYVGAGHYEYTGSYEYCSTYVYHNVGGWTYEEVPC